MMWGYYSGTPTTLGWIGGWLMMLLFWGAIIWLIVWAVRNVAGGAKRDNSALDILKERYARGEITKHEFEEKKKDIV